MRYINNFRFTSPKKFVNPKKINRTSGYLILEDDDGNIGLYTHWFPLIERMNRWYTQYRDYKPIACSPNVNTENVNTVGKVTTEQLQELVASGWEIVAHGKHHIGIGEHKLSSAVNQGEKKIYIEGEFYRTGLWHIGHLGYPYDYSISDGVNTETVKIVGHNTSDNSITFQNALNNNYAQGSIFQLTEESMVDLLQGSVDKLAEWGIIALNHTYAYHSGSDNFYSQKAIEVVRSLFNSSRGTYGSTNVPASADWANLAGLAIDGASVGTINTVLNNTVTNNLLTIVYGHGETSEEILGKLRYLIHECFRKGIRILTRQEAVKLLKPS